MHGADERLQVVERLDGLGAADNELLAPAAGRSRARRSRNCLVDDPAGLRQDVPPSERALESGSSSPTASQLDDVDAGVIGEQLGGVIEALDDVALAGGVRLRVGDAADELLAGEHLEQARRGFDRVLDREALEDASGTQRLPFFLAETILDGERLAGGGDPASRTFSVAGRGPHTRQKAVAL